MDFRQFCSLVIAKCTDLLMTPDWMAPTREMKTLLLETVCHRFLTNSKILRWREYIETEIRPKLLGGAGDDGGEFGKCRKPVKGTVGSLASSGG